MRVRFTQHKGYITARPVADADNERLVKELGAKSDGEPYLQSDHIAFMGDFERLGLVFPFFDGIFDAGPVVEVDVAEADFRLICLKPER